MPQKSLHFAVLFAASLLALPMSAASQGNVPQQRPTTIGGITVPPIAGAPFSATVVIESERDYDDGSQEIFRTISLIARDSKGRTHNEIRRFMPESFHGSPKLLEIRLFDPDTRIRTTCDPGLRIARQDFVPEAPKTTIPPNPSVQTVDLGADTLSGILTKGTRRTLTLSRKASGVGEPVQIQDEEWSSDELHLVLLARHTDPRIGVQTVAISGLKREEPPASMFEVPQGYRVLAAPPPSPAVDKPSAQTKP